MALLLSTVLFVVVGGLVALFGYRRYVLAGRVYENLEKLPQDSAVFEDAPNPNFFSVRKIAMAISRTLPASAEPASASKLKLRAAGHRDRSAVPLVYGLKFIS